MEKTRITLIEKIDCPGGFCMSVNETIEFYDGGFRRVGVNEEYYPVFGPYTQLQHVANEMVNGRANDMMKTYFKSEIVS